MRNIKSARNADVKIYSLNPGRVLVIIIFFILLHGLRANAQDYMGKNVAISNIGRVSIGNLLKRITARADFNFAYNNKSIPADSIVTISGYHGSLYNFLANLFGNDYEFKEVPGYVILRHAPNSLILTAALESDQSGELLVKGHVSDAWRKTNIAQVSVVEKDLLIAQLTDEQGNFSFKVNNPKYSILLTASKDNYRDTSVYLLPEIAVSAEMKKRHYKYDPDDSKKREKLQSGFSRFFITSKQKIQGLNLGGLFAYSPYQVSLTPGLSSHGIYNSQVINHLSINIIGGYTAGIQGVELGGVFNIDRSNVGFLQAADVFNIVGGNLQGIQLAGIYNQVLNNASGVQIAGVYNRANNLISGMQLSIIANAADTSHGFQLTGLINYSKTAGSQFSGMVNIAKKVHGFQFGPVNIADSSDYTIGLINLIKNGQKSLALTYDETKFMHLDFRSGGRALYGLLGTGLNTANGPYKYALDLGMGAYIIKYQKFAIDGEFVVQTTTDLMKNTYQTYGIKALPAYRLTRHFNLFAAPAFNFSSGSIDKQIQSSGWMIHQEVNDKTMNIFSVNIGFGLQYSW
jgi:hypothetical protein